MSEPRRDIDFRRLNLLGKLVYVGGAAARAVTEGVDRAIGHVADIVAESERAFREGADPNVEDAKIIEERRENRSKSSRASSPPDSSEQGG